MEYEIVDDRIHIFFDGDRSNAYALWPEELIRIVEAQEAGEHGAEAAGLADLLSAVLEEHPEVFVCHYNSDVVM